MVMRSEVYESPSQLINFLLYGGGRVTAYINLRGVHDFSCGHVRSTSDPLNTFIRSNMCRQPYLIFFTPWRIWLLVNCICSLKSLYRIFPK